MKQIIFCIGLVLSLMSCKSEDEKIREQNERDEEKREIEKKIIINTLTNKYKIKYQWDTLKYQYTIEYKKVIRSQFQLIDKFEIHDVFEKDSNTYISIITGGLFDYLLSGSSFYHPLFYFTLQVSNDMILPRSKLDDDLLLVVQVDKIKKEKLQLTTEEDEGYSQVQIVGSNTFIGYGKVIEIVTGGQ